MLIKGKNSSDNEKFLFGGFSCRPVPSAPEVFDTDADYPISGGPEDFLFVHIESEGWFFFKPNNGVIMEFLCDFESGGSISMGSDFVSVSMSYDFKMSVGITY